jgi:hypothetical protein
VPGLVRFPMTHQRLRIERDVARQVRACAGRLLQNHGNARVCTADVRPYDALVSLEVEAAATGVVVARVV